MDEVGGHSFPARACEDVSCTVLFNAVGSFHWQVKSIDQTNH